MRNFVLTSESMTVGHPDKLCDQISDAVVDSCLASDPEGGVVAECALASGVAFLSIRHRRPLAFDPAALARRVIAEAGYDHAHEAERATVMLDMVARPELPDRAAPAVASHMTTAFGYACDHTEARMPLPVWTAHLLTRRLDALRRAGAAPWLSPDAQAQVAVRFEERRPVAITGVALTIASEGHTPAGAALETWIRETLLAPALENAPLQADVETRIVAHLPASRGGPNAHAGLTGRKTAADAYGSFSRQSSSALSGKDPSRIDRIAAYAARQGAATVVAAGLARECEVQLSYAPGDAAPSSVEIDTFGGATTSDAAISKRLCDVMDFSVGAIHERLGLWEAPEARGGRFYRDFATYGHFGRQDLDAPWEATPLAAAIA